MKDINSLNSIINKKGKDFTIDNFKSNKIILKKERLTRSLEVEELQQISEIQQKRIKKISRNVKKIIMMMGTN